MKYRCYTYYNDELIGKYNFKTDDFESIFKEICLPTIKQGFKKGFTIDKQIVQYKKFCDFIYKQKINCYKIKCSDFYVFLNCYFSLVKFGKIKNDEFVILKKKERYNICGN